MPTPTSGAISMLNMRSEITRGAGQISMTEVRTRYGGSGQINFSDLYKSEGFTVNCGTITSKFFSADGWSAGLGIGSVSPNESNGMLQFAANSFLTAFQSIAGTSDIAQLNINANNGFQAAGVTAGFRGDSVTRVVAANTSRSLGSGDENTRAFTYNAPASGTIHCLIKF